jgi:hypothetical protein
MTINKTAKIEIFLIKAGKELERNSPGFLLYDLADPETPLQIVRVPSNVVKSICADFLSVMSLNPSHSFMCLFLNHPHMKSNS